MKAEDLINCLMLHCSCPSDTVIIVIDGQNYKLDGTVIGDEDEETVFVYATKEE